MLAECVTRVCHVYVTMNVINAKAANELSFQIQPPSSVSDPYVTSLRVQLRKSQETRQKHRSMIARGISTDFSRVFHITLYVKDGLK